MEPLLRNATDYSWVFSILLSVMIVLMAARLVFHKNFQMLGNLTLFTENPENTKSLAILSNVLLAVMVGLTVFKFIEFPFESSQNSGFSDAVLVTGIIAVYILTRLLVNILLIYLLGIQEELNHILKVKIYFRLFTVFLLVILNLFLYYSEFDPLTIFYISAAIIVIMVTLEYYFQLRKRYRATVYGSYYFILYLCILEILPVLLVFQYWSGLN